MISAGNDIVALGAVNVARTRTEQFYSKFLCPAEIQLYHGRLAASLSFENFVWLMWSAKEAAYKFCKRAKPDLVFAPSKCLVQSLQLPVAPYISAFGKGAVTYLNLRDDVYKGTISVGDDIICFQSQLFTDAVHTVAIGNNRFERICYGIKYINSPLPEDQSAAVRQFILDHLQLQFPGDNLQAEKHAIGYPFVSRNGTPLSLPLSFAHHDRLVAFSCSI